MSAALSVLSSDVATPGECETSVLPFFLCRVAALPTDAVEVLRSPEFIESLDHLQSASSRIDALKESVSELLFRAVGASTATDDRRRLIDARRALFNARELSRDKLERVETILSVEDGARVAEFNALLGQRRAAFDRLERATNDAKQSSREALSHSLGDEAFRRGLVASSETLFEALGGYLDGDRKLSAGERARIERGLLRYLTRAAMKATPFGTFCTILGGEIVETSDDASPNHRPLRIEGPTQQRSIVRLNKGIYGRLVGHLAFCQTIRDRLFVQLNPTISAETGGLVFLAVYRGLESFQRYDENGLLDVTMRVMQSLARPTVTDLVNALASSPELDCTAEEAEQLVSQLLGSGFLRLATDIPEQEADWDQPLCQMLARIGESPAPEVRAELVRLRELANEYSVAPARMRIGLLASMRRSAEQAFKAAGSTNPSTQLLPVLEDATATANAELCDVGAVRELLDTVQDFVALTRRISPARAEQAIMRHFFDVHYGNGVNAVPLLRFYEDFHREHRKPHLERVAAQGRAKPGEQYNASNPFDQAFVRALQNAQKRITALLSDKCTAAGAADEIDITAAELSDIIDEVGPPVSETTSVGIFCTFVPPTDDVSAARLIVPRGGYGEGFGKFFSRFLHVLPETVTTALRERTGAHHDLMLAEICGDANFNANLHPPIMPWEISYPTGEGGATNKQIPVGEIVVERNRQNSQGLTLRHVPTGQRVAPIDLGFLTRDRRPALYQLLSRFTPVCQFSLGIADPAAASSEQGLSRSVRYRPRIVFDNHLVLSRRTWFVGSDCIPRRNPQEPDHLFFARIDAWRRLHGLPREAYLRVRVSAPRTRAALPNPEPNDEQKADNEQKADSDHPNDSKPTPPAAAAASPQSLSRGKRNLVKPQYIDFGSPLLLLMLEHVLAEEREFTLIVEERYPTSAGLAQWDGAPHSTELLVEFDFSERPGSAG